MVMLNLFFGGWGVGGGGVQTKCIMGHVEEVTDYRLCLHNYKTVSQTDAIP